MDPQLAVSVSPKERWAGRIIAALVLLFLLSDSIGHIAEMKGVVEWSTTLGLAVNSNVGVGITLLVCMILYVVPRTSVLGAIVITGYLGGAVAINFRVGNALFGHTLLPAAVGFLLWLSLYLREPRLRILIPLKKICD
jgi:hypothetical protein